MDIANDSHLNMKWKIDPNDQPQIITDEPDTNCYWNICRVACNIPGDRDGELVAQQIVDDHNEMLAARTHQRRDDGTTVLGQE